MEAQLQPLHRQEELPRPQPLLRQYLMPVVPLRLIGLDDPAAPGLLPERCPGVRGDVHSIEVVAAVQPGCRSAVRKVDHVSPPNPTMCPTIEKMPCAFRSRQAR